MSEAATGEASVAGTAAKKLGSPCRIVNALKAALYLNPATGSPLLAINSCTPGAGSHGAALLIDYENDWSHVLPLPAGSGGWAIIQTAPGRLLFESLAPLYLISVDMNPPAVDETAVIEVPESQYAWSFVQGPDGKVYFGSFPTCHAYRYDPVTHEVEDLGHMAPEKEGNLYVRHVAVARDDWMLCDVGTERFGIVACNLRDGTQQWLAGTELIDRLTPNALLSVAGTAYASIDKQLKQFDPRTVGFKDVDLPPAPDGLPWSALLPTSSAARLLATTDEHHVYLIEPGAAPRLIWNLDLRGGRVADVDDKGRILGVRGQEYFVAEPLAGTIEPQPMATEPPPVAIHFLRADPEGGVTGGPTFGQTLFRFDPARNLMQNTPQVVDSAGAVSGGPWIDGKFYFAVYASGELGVWDPQQPWDQWNRKNPRVLANYHSPEYGSLIRSGGLVAGPRGRLYGGWMAAYGMASGGLSEYDIARGAARSWSSELFDTEMSIGVVAADNLYVYGCTSNAFNGIQREPRDLTFWAFDPVEQRVAFKQTLEGVTGLPAVACIPETGRVWLAGPSGLWRFDTETLSFVEQIAWPDGVGAPLYIAASDARGDCAWFVLGNLLLKLQDGAMPTVVVQITADMDIRGLAAGFDGQLYYTQGVEVWAAPL